MSKAAVEFRRGQLIAGIESARQSLVLAGRAADLLSDEDRARLVHVRELLAGIEQHVWKAKP